MEKLTLSSPIGNITLIGEDGFIVRICFDDSSVIRTNVDGSFTDNVKRYGENLLKIICLQDKISVFVTNSPISCNEQACSCEIQGDYQAYMIKATEEIVAYFNREIRLFTFPVKMAVPPFSQRVYGCLKSVPYGETVTYKELGIMAGMNKGFRAIGQIMKRNPLPIVYPCHRVVSSGGIGGFSGGPDIKRFLLALEGNTEVSQK